MKFIPVTESEEKALTEALKRLNVKYFPDSTSYGVLRILRKLDMARDIKNVGELYRRMS